MNTVSGAPSNSPINGGGPEATVNTYKIFRSVGDRIRGLAKYTERQREMRKNPTEVEKKLWEILKGKQVNGLKFRRQHGVGLYIVDFYCDQLKLIIEVDGSVHDTVEAKKYDHERTQYFECAGYRILRFRNSEVFNNSESILEMIQTEFTSGPPPFMALDEPEVGGGKRGLGEA